MKKTIMTVKELQLKEAFGYKVYYKKDIAYVARYLDSKWWNPFDWYKVKIF